MITLIYSLIAIGYSKQTGKVWDAILWPVCLGKAIARAATEQEEAK